MRCAVTGSFDPITLGHIDIVKRAATMYDEVYVVVLNNETKNYMFSLHEREVITRNALKDIPNVVVDSYDGYVIDYCRDHDINVVIRGYRNAKDFEYETNMSRWNMNYGDIETLLIAQDKKSYLDISSSLARDNINDEEELKKYLSQDTIEMIKEIKNNGKQNVW